MIIKLSAEFQEQTNKQKDNVNQSVDKADKAESYRIYHEEYCRLEKTIKDSEKIWEDRTFGIAAGGLSLSFAMFSFGVDQDVAQSIACYMPYIWAGYVICLILNYLSNRTSMKICRQLQETLISDRDWGLPYDTSRLKIHYEKGNKKMNIINRITEVLLILSVLSTLIVTFLIVVK